MGARMTACSMVGEVKTWQKGHFRKVLESKGRDQCYNAVEVEISLMHELIVLQEIRWWKLA